MATDTNVDEGKRRFLVAATSVVGGIGAAAAATPFLISFWPSERAKAAGAPVEIDINKIEPGEKNGGERGGCADRDRYQQDRAGTKDRRRMARQGGVAH